MIFLHKIFRVMLFTLIVHPAFSQNDSLIYRLNEEDIYQSRYSPYSNTIKLNLGTIIVKDTNLIQPILDGINISYKKFENLFLSGNVAENINLSIDSIATKKIANREKVYIYCTSKSTLKK